jgi:hypothetical protein
MALQATTTTKREMHTVGIRKTPWKPLTRSLYVGGRKYLSIRHLKIDVRSLDNILKYSWPPL